MLKVVFVKNGGAILRHLLPHKFGSKSRGIVFTAVIRRGLELWIERSAKRRAIRLLESYDDRMLKDIGIRRSDIESAVGGFWRLRGPWP